MPAKSTPKFTVEQLEKALDLQARSYTQAAIAAELGVSRRTITRALARVNRAAFARLMGRLDALKARQIAQHEWCARQAARQWERSVEDATTTRTTVLAGDVIERLEKTVKPRTGDASLLREVREALRDIRTILGLDQLRPDAPLDDYVIDLSGPDPLPRGLPGPDC
jgi:IS30 family transposase